MPDFRRIIMEDDPILRQPAIVVRRFSTALHKLLNDMKATMYHESGVGLAAPQIGISKSLVVADDREEGYIELVNPVIIEAKGAEEAVEYCLSVPNRGGRVVRATHIKIKAQDRYGAPFTISAHGIRARILQHEIDHLHGRLFTDIMIAEVRDEDEE